MEPSKGQRIAGWVLTAFTGLGLLASAAGKFAGGEELVKNLDHLGFPLAQIKTIGVVEVVCAVLYLIPRTTFLGAVLVTGYLGGATCAHVRVGDPFVAPVVLGVLVWAGVALRRTGVFKDAFGI